MKFAVAMYSTRDLPELELGIVGIYPEVTHWPGVDGSDSNRPVEYIETMELEDAVVPGTWPNIACSRRLACHSVNGNGEPRLGVIRVLPLY